MTPKNIMEGSWQLALWYDGVATWRTPEVSGRFILRDGVVVFMASRPLREEGRYTRHAYGFYEFDHESWSYGYHQDLMLWETPDGIRVDHELPWLGLKPFRMDVRPTEVSLETADKKYRLLFETHRFSYFEKDLLVRVWTRI